MVARHGQCFGTKHSSMIAQLCEQFSLKHGVNLAQSGQYSVSKRCVGAVQQVRHYAITRNPSHSTNLGIMMGPINCVPSTQRNQVTLRSFGTMLSVAMKREIVPFPVFNWKNLLMPDFKEESCNQSVVLGDETLIASPHPTDVTDKRITTYKTIWNHILKHLPDSLPLASRVHPISIPNDHSDCHEHTILRHDRTLRDFNAPMSNLLPNTSTASQRTTSPNIWVKRDDELPHGTKLRKWSSLVAALQSRNVTDVVLVGNFMSNNVVAGAQMLLERGIRPWLVVRGDFQPDEAPSMKTADDIELFQGKPPVRIRKAKKSDSKRDNQTQTHTYMGNELLLEMLLPHSRIFWVPRQRSHGPTENSSSLTDTERLNNAAKFLSQRIMDKNELDHTNSPTSIQCEVIEEGATHVDSIHGASTLLFDILRNERETQCNFSDIVMDAGTGFSAAALAMANEALVTTPKHFFETEQLGSPKRIHVVILARSGISDFIHQLLRIWNTWGKQIPGIESLNIPELQAGCGMREDDIQEIQKYAMMHHMNSRNHKSCTQVYLHRPRIAQSFGAVNRSVVRSSIEWARSTGMVLDPIYNTKLFESVASDILPAIQNDALLDANTVTNLLMVHSGGTFSVFGYSDTYTNQLKQLDTYE